MDRRLVKMEQFIITTAIKNSDRYKSQMGNGWKQFAPVLQSSIEMRNRKTRIMFSTEAEFSGFCGNPKWFLEENFTMGSLKHELQKRSAGNNMTGQYAL